MYCRWHVPTNEMTGGSLTQRLPETYRGAMESAALSSQRRRLTTRATGKESAGWDLVQFDFITSALAHQRQQAPARFPARTQAATSP